MDTRAISKYVKISPMKARAIADLVRLKKTTEALDILNFSKRKSASYIQETLKSAIANAKNNFGLSEDNLYISELKIDQGPAIRRLNMRARGGRDIIDTKTSHITIILSEIEEGKGRVTRKKETPKVIQEEEIKEEQKIEKKVEEKPQEETKEEQKVEKEFEEKKQKPQERFSGFKKWVKSSKRFFRRKGG